MSKCSITNISLNIYAGPVLTMLPGTHIHKSTSQLIPEDESIQLVKENHECGNSGAIARCALAFAVFTLQRLNVLDSAKIAYAIRALEDQEA